MSLNLPPVTKESILKELKERKKDFDSLNFRDDPKIRRDSIMFLSMVVALQSTEPQDAPKTGDQHH